MAERQRRLYAAIVAAQAEMPHPMAHAEAQGRKFADLKMVLETVTPVLNRHGLAITQFLTDDPRGRDDYIGIETVLVHEKGGSISRTVPVRVDAQRGCNYYQSMGILCTYVRRYGVSAVAGVYADKDTDGAAPEPRNGKRPASAPADGPDEYGGI